MKVFLGGTVNGSKWREYVIPRLKIDYFDPVVKIWNDEAYELELYEKRHANYCLYVITPKLTGYFSIAEIIDDAFHKPDQTVYCFLKEDQNFSFNEFELNTLEDLGQTVIKNGGTWLRNLDEVIEFLNEGAEDSVNYDHSDKIEYHDCFISYGRTMSKALSKDFVSHLKKNSFNFWIDDNLSALGPEKIEFINKQIRSAGNFVFIITPQSVKSEICVRELEFAILNRKSIVVLHHISPQGDWEKVRQILKDYKWHYFEESALDNIFSEIDSDLLDDLENKKLYTELLQRSDVWSRKGRNNDDLLYGQDRAKFAKWRNNLTTNSLELNKSEADYLMESFNQHLSTRLINKSAQNLEFITHHKNFERIIGLIALVNPLSFIPQLMTVSNDLSNGEKSNGVSVIMFVIFFLINLSLVLVWIKQRNKGMLISVLLSLIIILSIVTIVLCQ